MAQGRAKQQQRGGFLPAGDFLPGSLDSREKRQFPRDLPRWDALDQGCCWTRDAAAHGCFWLGQCFAKQSFALWYWTFNLQHEQWLCTFLVLSRELFPQGQIQTPGIQGQALKRWQVKGQHATARR